MPSIKALLVGNWIQFHSWKCILVWEIRNALKDETCCCARLSQNGGFAHISIAKHKIVLTSGSYAPHCGGNHILLIGTIEPKGNVPSYFVFCLITSTKLIGYLQLLQVARMTRNPDDISGFIKNQHEMKMVHVCVFLLNCQYLMKHILHCYVWCFFVGSDDYEMVLLTMWWFISIQRNFYSKAILGWYCDPPG